MSFGRSNLTYRFSKNRNGLFPGIRSQRSGVPGTGLQVATVSSFLATTQKFVGTLNQIRPLVNQFRPWFGSARQLASSFRFNRRGQQGSNPVTSSGVTPPTEEKEVIIPELVGYDLQEDLAAIKKRSQVQPPFFTTD